MTYRDIPFVIFNSVIEQDSLRAFEPKTTHPVVNQVANLRQGGTVAIYGFSDTIPEFASAFLRIPSREDRTHVPDEDLFQLEMAMVKEDWQLGKGGLFVAELIMVMRLKISRLSVPLVRLLADISSRAISLRISSARERFWEYEMYPKRNYSKQD